VARTTTKEAPDEPFRPDLRPRAVAARRRLQAERRRPLRPGLPGRSSRGKADAWLHQGAALRRRLGPGRPIQPADPLPGVRAAGLRQ